MKKYILLFIPLLLSCSKNKNINEINSQIDLKIEFLSDSTFFSDIRCMQYDNGIVYALDVNRRQVIASDVDFSTAVTIGSAGLGPEELAMPLKFHFCNDTIYILDSGCGGIKTFYKNTFEAFYQLNCAADMRFFYNNGKLYLPCVTDSSSISVRNLDSIQKSLKVGDVFMFESANQVQLRNDRHLLLDGESFFYSTSDNIPLIEQYDLETLKLISSLDLSNIPLIKKNIDYISSQSLKENSYYVQFKDSYLANNCIYILCASLGDIYKANQLIEINLYPRMTVSNIYKLPGKIYSSFCVSAEYIFGFNEYESSIDRIKLLNNE